MFDHISIRVKSFKKAKPFYAESLAPLGYKVLHESEGSIGLGDGKNPTVWIAEDQPATGAVHVAFTGSDRKAVDAFHKAALKAGGRDNGKPGLRTDYSPTYYAAFAYDPDGNNIEAVCHKG